MAFLTRRGALSVTTDLDRIANLFQNQHDVLGVPKEYAVKFAYYCDVLSDQVEKHAIKLAEEAEAEETDEGSKKEAGCEKLPEGGMRDNCEAKKEEGKKASTKKADDETGLSVDHGASGFDANVIGDEVGGPLEIIQPPSEPWMDAFYTQGGFQELSELQQSGALANSAQRGAIITKLANTSLARLRRLASGSRLSTLADGLKVFHAKLSAATMAEVKALAPEVKKQIDAVSKVRDALIEQQALGLVEPVTLAAADRIIQAVSEQIPYIQQVVTGVDSGSPVALLEFQKMLGGGSLKELLALGASIVVDAAKDISKEAAVVASEITEKEEIKEDTVGPEKKDDAPKSEKEDGSDKNASTLYGYDLFAS